MDLMIDQEFTDKIPPLTKEEFEQLEANILADGLVINPLIVWNRVIVDGHNRYRILQKHPEIPFQVHEKEFSDRYEVIAWICAKQLKRRNLTDETRKFLIGMQYESEKIVTRRKAIFMGDQEDQSGLPYETFDPDRAAHVAETKKKTAERIGEENHISHGTVEKYSVYARAIEEISRKEPRMASKILSGRYKVSHDGVLALAQRSAEELHDMNKRLEHTQQPYARYQTTRQEIQSMPAHRKRDPGKKPSVKDMPAYDPDAEVVGLTLTIPSWSSSIDRIAHSNLDIVSDAARLQLHRALLELQEIINTMISAITEEQ